MIHPGLCSVTFRELSPEQVIALARDAAFTCIEWGGDVHVPAGERETARRVRELTEQAGLRVASYGSYLRCTGTDREFAEESAAVIATARALGAPRIRVWAGDEGSAATPADQRAVIVRRLRELTARAAEHGIGIGLEFHGGTLTDRIESTLQLLDEVDAPALSTYWQPHRSQPEPEALETLRRALPRVSTLHVFSWWPDATRLPLAERGTLWREAFGIVQADGRDHDALLEFLPGDDPALLPTEAAALRLLIVAGGGG